MRELAAEEKEFLVDYCMKPKNTRLALEIGQIYCKLRKKIMSSFLEKLDNSVKTELNERNCQWQTCIPTANQKLEDGSWSLYIMTMQEQGIEIHLARDKWQDLFVGTPKSNGDWPNGALLRFKELVDRSLETRHKDWYWWFNEEKHTSIESIEALSTLNSSQKIEYFTAELVRFAEAISEALEAQE